MINWPWQFPLYLKYWLRSCLLLHKLVCNSNLSLPLGIRLLSLTPTCLITDVTVLAVTILKQNTTYMKGQCLMISPWRKHRIRLLSQCKKVMKLVTFPAIIAHLEIKLTRTVQFPVITVNACKRLICVKWQCYTSTSPMTNTMVSTIWSRYFVIAFRRSKITNKKLWTMTTGNRNYEHWLQEIETMNIDYKNRNYEHWLVEIETTNID